MPKPHPVSKRRHLSLPRPLIPLTRATTRAQCPGENNEVLIIGAGLSGLSAGLRLLGAGKSVTIVEADSSVGGLCRTETLESAHGSFDADTGATVLTMPELIESAIMSAGINPRDLEISRADGSKARWQRTRLSPAYVGQFASGRYLRVFADRGAMHKELRRFAKDKYLCGAEDPRVSALIEGYDRQRTWSQEMFTLAYENFLAADFDSPLDVFSTPAAASSMMRLMMSGAMGSLGNITAANINDAEVERMFTFQALYAGVAPKKARGVYSVISHMDSTMGVFYPEYSIGEAAEFMALAFQQAGGTLRLNTPVTALHYEGVQLTEVELADETRLAPDVVISTADVGITRKLLGEAAEENSGKLHYSPSAVVVHGTIATDISAQWDRPAHHTLSFGEAWNEVFEQLTNHEGSLMEDPSLLITRPGLSAPARIRQSDGLRYEPLSVLAPAPNLHSATVDWPTLQDHYVREILQVLDRREFPGIADNLAIARVDTPHSYATRGYSAGTPFSLAHTLGQTGPFRTKNYPGFGYTNLVLAGAGTTPGVGVPTVLLSGALAARRITGGGVR